MENLILSANVVLPLFFLMVVGYVMRRCNIFDENTLKQMNKATFRVFLPCLIFYNVYTMWSQNYSFMAKNKNQQWLQPLKTSVFSFFLKFLQKKDGNACVELKTIIYLQ